MTLPVYGWSEESYDVVKNIDLVYVLAHFVSKVIPRYSLFIFAQFLVLLALGDAFYAAKLFKGNTKVQTMWPIKLLRFLVGSVVTILFSSVLKWLIIPIDCQVSDEKSLSSYFHGEDAPCTPWIFPEMVFSTVSVLSAVAYMLFAIVVSSLCFETNLLARGVRAASTGRVEALWILAKVAVTFMAYLVQWLQAVSCAIVLLILMLVVLYNHVTVLPFHRHETNLIRGGVFFFVSWLALATVIVSAADVEQSTEWALLALTPVFFVLGVCFTHWVRLQHDRSIERLRAEFLHLQNFSDKGSSRPDKSRTEPQPQDDAQSFSRFYDPTWESRKAFTSPARAKVILRTLLYRRERQDVDFLLYALDRAILEYPESEELRIFELLLVRFIKQDHMEAQMLEKRYKNDKKLLPIDYRYVLFALERKALKESAGAHLGKGKFSVINVMEFDAGMERARKAHMLCITALRKFWSSTKHMRVADRHSVMIEEMLSHLSSLNNAIVLAKGEYSSLVELYPTSVTLLHTYAHFCDTILNDPTEGAKWRLKAETLEELSEADDSTAMSGGEGDEEGARDKKVLRLEDEHDGGKSSVSGFSASGKTVLERNQIAWRESLLKEEMLTMHRLHVRVKMMVLLMLITGAAGYFVMNHVLLSDMAVANINSIDSTLKFAGYSIMSMHLLRDQEIAARKYDSSRRAHDTVQINEYMNELKKAHYLNFEHLPSKEIEEFYTGVGGHTDDHLIFNEPFISGWKHNDLNFWDGINAWVRRVQRATQATPDELRQESFVLADISDEKRNIAFVMENTIPVVLPSYEELLHLYQGEVHNFVQLAEVLINITATINSVLTLLVSLFVIWMVRRVVPKVQSKRACVYIALRFPRKCQSKLRSFYQDLEHKMEELEEGLQMKEEELGSEGGGQEQDGQLLSANQGTDDEEARGGVGLDLEGGRDRFRMGSTEAALQYEDPLLPHSGAVFKLPRSTSNQAGAGAFSPPKMKDLVGHQSQGSMLTAENVTHHIAQYDGFSGSRRSKGGFDGTWTPRGGPDFSQRSPVGRGAQSPVDGMAEAQRLNDSFVQRAIRGMRMDHARASFRQSKKQIRSPGNSRSGSFRREPDQRSESPQPRARSPSSPRERSPRNSRRSASPQRARSSLRNTMDLDKLTHATTSNDRRSKTQSWLEDNSGLYRGSPSSSPVGAVSSDQDKELSMGSPRGDKASRKFHFKLSSDLGEACELPDDVKFPDTIVPVPRRHLISRNRGVVEKINTGDVQEAETEAEHAHEPETAELQLPPPPEPVQPQPATEPGSAEQMERQEAASPAKAAEDGDEDEEAEKDPGPAFTRKQLPPLESPTSTPPANARPIIKYDASPLAALAEDMPIGLLNVDEDVPAHMLVGKSKNDDPTLHVTELDEPFIAELERNMIKQRQWHSRATTWLAALVFMAGFSLFATIYPMRVLPDIQDMAPIVDHGGRRGYMMQECVFLARELIMDDGYSRMDATEIAHLLDHALQRLRVEHNAVRLGGDQGIRKGADLRFASHNRVMYEPGCAWRDAQQVSSSGSGAHRRETTQQMDLAASCSFGDGVHEDASRNGLHHLIVTFFDTVEAVLDKWGPQGWRDADPETHAHEDEFTSLHSKPERLSTIELDIDFHFLELAFEGDLLQGLNFVQDLFHDETHHMLDVAHLENEILFILYILAVTCMWYGILFRSVSNSADKELNRARDFVARLPLQVMTTKEMNCIGTIFFEAEKDRRDEDGHDDASPLDAGQSA